MAIRSQRNPIIGILGFIRVTERSWKNVTAVVTTLNGGLDLDCLINAHIFPHGHLDLFPRPDGSRWGIGVLRVVVDASHGLRQLFPIPTVRRRSLNNIGTLASHCALFQVKQCVTKPPRELRTWKKQRKLQVHPVEKYGIHRVAIVLREARGGLIYDEFPSSCDIETIRDLSLDDNTCRTKMMEAGTFGQFGTC